MNVPKLRFPEFWGMGEWEEKTIGEISRVVTGKTPSTNDDSLWNGDIQFVTPTDISEDQKYQWHTQRSVTNHAKISVLPKFSIMFTCIASIGKMAMSVKPCITNQQINTLIPNNGYSNEFVYYVLLNITPLIKSTQANTTLPIINKTEFSKFNVPIPPVPEEQQKIADCLSSLDELVTAETQTLEAYKQHKKGLMQQLFPQTGETTPRLRFPEFREAGEWEMKQFKDVCQMQAGKFVRAAEIQEKHELNLYPCYGGNGQRGFTKSFTHDGKYSLIGRQGALCGNVTLAKGKFHATEHAVVVSPNSSVDTDWLFFILGYLDLNQHATGQAQPGLSVENLEKLPINIPKDRVEQQKIANCLSSFDDLITAQSQKIEALKLHKKGLMQSLFPNDDEVAI